MVPRIAPAALAAATLLAAAGAAGAQQPARDTSAAHRDTTHAAPDTSRRSAVPLPSDTLSDTTKVPKDTIKAPLAHAEIPPLLGVGEPYRFTREQIFASGAVNLLDLLALVPGVTVFRSGWLGAPQYAAYLGNPVRVRVFLDGLELDPLDPRSRGVLDVSEAQPWAMEDVAIERGADELRVYLRSWRVQRTTTNTRVDVLTGDQGTNLYRGFYGKRYDNGMALQLAGQQWGTTSNPAIGGGDELALTGRLGWARGRWSVDAYASRSSRSRDEQDVQLQGANGGVPAEDRTRTDAYLRAAYGDPDEGPWAQVLAGMERFDEHTPFRTTPLAFAPADTADTLNTSTQIVATGGFTRWGLRLSAAERLHLLPGRTLNSLSARLAYERPSLAVSLFTDQRLSDTTSTEEGSVRWTPFGRVTLTGAITRRHGGGADVPGSATYALRGEAGVRLGSFWLSGGALRRDADELPGLTAYDSAYAGTGTGSASGIFGTARGKIYQDIGVDVMGVRWTAPGYYRPQLQSREEIYLDTKWLSRFPSGHFGLLASAAHEYRGDALFPVAGSAESLSGGAQVAVYSHVLATRIEVRILDAVIFWHSTYGISPPTFEYVPGFLQPRQRFLYGVRWQFWN